MHCKLTLKNSKTVFTYDLDQLEYVKNDGNGNEYIIVSGVLIKQVTDNEFPLAEGKVFDKFIFGSKTNTPPSTIEFY
jgi:hypothetical protein